LFATKKIPTGTSIIRVRGHTPYLREPKDLAPDTYLYALQVPGDENKNIHWVLNKNDSNARFYFKLNSGENLPNGNNCDFVFGGFRDGRPLYDIETVRDIEKDEELFVNYGDLYGNLHDGDDGDPNDHENGENGEKNGVRIDVVLDAYSLGDKMERYKKILLANADAENVHVWIYTGGQLSGKDIPEYWRSVIRYLILDTESGIPHSLLLDSGIDPAVGTNKNIYRKMFLANASDKSDKNEFIAIKYPEYLRPVNRTYYGCVVGKKEKAEGTEKKKYSTFLNNNYDQYENVTYGIDEIVLTDFLDDDATSSTFLTKKQCHFDDKDVTYTNPTKIGKALNERELDAVLTDKIKRERIHTFDDDTIPRVAAQGETLRIVVGLFAITDTGPRPGVGSDKGSYRHSDGYLYQIMQIIQKTHPDFNR